MFRVYQLYRKQREQEEERWVTDLIREAQEEQQKNPMGPEDLVKELKELARDVSLQAKKRGIKPKDVNRIIEDLAGSGGLLRVVVDTNVYISAFLHPERPIFQIVQQAAEHRYCLLISPAIVNEVGRVLRETFGLEERVRLHRPKALPKPRKSSIL